MQSFELRAESECPSPSRIRCLPVPGAQTAMAPSGHVQISTSLPVVARIDPRLSQPYGTPELHAKVRSKLPTFAALVGCAAGSSRSAVLTPCAGCAQRVRPHHAAAERQPRGSDGSPIRHSPLAQPRRKRTTSPGRESWIRNPAAYGSEGAAHSPWGDAHRSAAPCPRTL